MKNYSIKCNVDKCKHNFDGSNCSLDCICVKCSCGENCTCCSDFSEKE